MMPDNVELNIPKDAAVRVMCHELRVIRQGFAALGLHMHILDQVTEKLEAQALEIERMRSDRQYVIGHNDGWDAAMATGLAGGEKEQHNANNGHDTD